MKEPKVPTRVQKWLDANPDKVVDYYVEEDYFEPDYGRFSVWIHLARGWYCRLMDCHTIHEARSSDAMEMIDSIAPCDCETCSP